MKMSKDSSKTAIFAAIIHDVSHHGSVCAIKEHFLSLWKCSLSNARTLLPFRRCQVLGRAEEAWQMYRSLWVFSVGYRASYSIQSISRFSAFVFVLFFARCLTAHSRHLHQVLSRLVYCPLKKYKGVKSVAVTAACAHSGHSGRRKWCTNHKCFKCEHFVVHSHQHRGSWCVSTVSTVQCSYTAVNAAQ